MCAKYQDHGKSFLALKIRQDNLAPQTFKLFPYPKLKFPPHAQIITTWEFDLCFPCHGISSRVKLHVSAMRVGVDRETTRDDFTSGCNRKTRLNLFVFPEEGEGYPCPGVTVK